MIREWISKQNPEAILWNNCDDALIGITPSGNAIYSIEKLWDVFMAQEMTRDEAIDWVDYNIIGAYVGKYTPIHVYTE